ncbi:hypothetical protein EVAR_29868_1 [Eumeta japonica]|uniref:Uncharacterized protein n=1 Tax=Eumeta variegata TaxID=151549 RepID=A0A4C1V6P1_EUMVA|nr:hypothetical protein EVAR_29868_1 [Eumeta japonica]
MRRGEPEEHFDLPTAPETNKSRLGVSRKGAPRSPFPPKPHQNSRQRSIQDLAAAQIQEFRLQPLPLTRDSWLRRALSCYSATPQQRASTPAVQFAVVCDSVSSKSIVGEALDERSVGVRRAVLKRSGASVLVFRRATSLFREPGNARLDSATRNVSYANTRYTFVRIFRETILGSFEFHEIQTLRGMLPSSGGE